MVKKESIDRIIETHLVSLSNKKGIIIDGFPRNLKQVHDFEEKVFPLHLPIKFEFEILIELFLLQIYF